MEVTHGVFAVVAITSIVFVFGFPGSTARQMALLGALLVLAEIRRKIRNFGFFLQLRDAFFFDFLLGVKLLHHRQQVGMRLGRGRDSGGSGGRVAGGEMERSSSTGTGWI